MKAFLVSKRLAFGSAIKTWSHVEKLHALGITHIINLRWSQNNAKVLQFPYTWLRFHDDKKPRPALFYRRALSFYERAVRDPKAKLFVMCHHGLCRSPSLVYFLLRSSGATSRKAEALVRKTRPCAKVVRAYRESGEDYMRRMRRWRKVWTGGRALP